MNPWLISDRSFRLDDQAARMGSLLRLRICEGLDGQVDRSAPAIRAILDRLHRWDFEYANDWSTKLTEPPLYLETFSLDSITGIYNMRMSGRRNRQNRLGTSGTSLWLIKNLRMSYSQPEIYPADDGGHSRHEKYNLKT
jgi:hypothetical protein